MAAEHKRQKRVRDDNLNVLEEALAALQVGGWGGIGGLDECVGRSVGRSVGWLVGR
jgi:hypothetical protein